MFCCGVLLLLLLNVLLWKLISTMWLGKGSFMMNSAQECNVKGFIFVLRDVSPYAHKWETYGRLKLKGPFHLFMIRLGNTESLKVWKDNWHLECENSGTFFCRVHISFFTYHFPEILGSQLFILNCKKVWLLSISFIFCLSSPYTYSFQCMEWFFHRNNSRRYVGPWQIVTALKWP